MIKMAIFIPRLMQATLPQSMPYRTYMSYEEITRHFPAVTNFKRIWPEEKNNKLYRADWSAYQVYWDKRDALEWIAPWMSSDLLDRHAVRLADTGELPDGLWESIRTMEEHVRKLRLQIQREQEENAK